MNAPAGRVRTGFKFMLIVKGGPDQGVSFQLLPPKVTIGRDAENNVALSDPRVSRQAAIIEFSQEQIVIKDVSTRQSMLVDGESKKLASIVDGTKLQIGDSELLFVVEAIPLDSPFGVPLDFPHGSPVGYPVGDPATKRIAPQGPASSHLSVVKANSPNIANHPGEFAGPASQQHRSSSSQGGSRRNQTKDTGKIKFYIFFFALLGLVVWLLTSSPKEKPKDPTLKTVEEIQKDLEGSEKRQDELIKKRSFKNDEERTRYEEANRHYLEGFRDYREGQWSRALRSFETASAIDPTHELARRYYKLAEKQRDEMIATLTLEGRRYKEKQMYSRCSAALEKVLDVITNRDDLKYKQAEAMKRECDLSIGDKY